MRRLIALFAVLWLASPALARAEKPRVEILDYGTYATGPRKTIPMPVSVSGTMNIVSGVRLMRQTREVIGQLGTSFGFRYRVLGVPPGAKIVIRTKTPMLTNPETHKSMDYAEREQAVMPGEERYTGYSFDSTYEIGEGDWTFQIIYQGRVIGEQTFKIVVPMN
jgi:hypothetical protein